MRDRAIVGRVLIVSFTAVVLTSTAGIVIAEAFNASIGEAASEIATNSSPSLVYLANMRMVLRELNRRLDARARECPADDCAPPADIAELRRELSATWALYRRLPPLPGEPKLWPAIDRALAELEAALGSALEPIESPARAPVRGPHLRSVPPLVDRLDVALASLGSFDYERGLSYAATIRALSRRALVAAVVIDAVSIALSALAILTLRQVLRYQRLLQDRAEELDAFGGRVAHDIRDPLGSAAIALDVAGAEPSTERARVLLRRARRSLDRVQLLVDDLLEFARAGAAPARGASAGLGEVVRSVVAELTPAVEAERVALQVAAVQADAVACSPGVLVSILSNVVRNAITHMGASTVREVRIRSRAARADGAVRVEVEDTGPGVPASVAARVFEPFVRGPDARRSGSGLGLATARRLVTAYGGRIGFDSRPGGGAVFWFELPRP